MTAPELMRLLQRNLPAADWHDFVLEELGEGVVRLRLPLRDSYVSRDLPAGSGQAVMSGPLMMSLADTAMYACAHAAYGENVFAAIVNFNVTFLRVAGAADLIAQARLLRAGETLAFLEAELFSGANAAPCARVSASYAIRRPK